MSIPPGPSDRGVEASHHASHGAMSRHRSTGRSPVGPCHRGLERVELLRIYLEDVRMVDGVDAKAHAFLNLDVK